MIKTKTGNYLKELRKKKGWSLEKLASVIGEKSGDTISINSVSDWEKGVNYPSVDNLEILAEIYDKNIDEILDGEDYLDIDYSKEYIISNEHWGLKFDNKANLGQIKNESILKIVKRFKELLSIRITREFTHNEENEFKFLFNNFYGLSEYANIEYVNTDSNDEYLRLKSAIIKCLIDVRNMADKEKYWELEKLFNEKEVIWFKYLNDIEGIKEDRLDIIKSRFDNLEDRSHQSNVSDSSMQDANHGRKRESREVQNLS
jgi:transcriptional regulator with XRE-family HTH domain